MSGLQRPRPVVNSGQEDVLKMGVHSITQLPNSRGTGLEAGS